MRDEKFAKAAVLNETLKGDLYEKAKYLRQKDN
jgi:hypothetical protein